MRLLLLLLFVLCLVALVAAATRARQLFVLTIKDGKTKLKSGRAPADLLEALGDVFARAKVENARVTVLRSDGRPRIEASGLDAFTLQRARNVLGVYPAHKLVGSR